MRLTIRTNLAMRTLMYCAVNEGNSVRRHDVALACNASENHLGQVIHMLASTGFLRTQRGRTGGLMLARDPASITVGQVFRIFEAHVPFTECAALTTNSCPLTPCCRLKGSLGRALAAFYAELDRVTLAELVTGNTELNALLLAA